MIAVLIAFPAAWWILHQWLQRFAYRIEVGMDVFIITGITVLLITLLTIGIQAIKASLANPVNSLRTE